MLKERKNSKGKYERYCKWCGQRFETYLPQQRYCKHEECRRWAEKIRHLKRKDIKQNEQERISVGETLIVEPLF